jgi:hypothetical protein
MWILLLRETECPYHVATIRRPGRHSIFGINIVIGVGNVLKPLDEIIVWCSAPIVPDGIGKFLAIACGSSGIDAMFLSAKCLSIGRLWLTHAIAT